MNRLVMNQLVLCASSLLVFAGLAVPAARADEALELKTRWRVEIEPGSGKHRAVTGRTSWDPKQTAAVICDMWDEHHCRNAAYRVAEMAPRMNQVVHALRDRGVLIIHCPSDTMEFYRDHPARQPALMAPKVQTEIALQNWCHLDGSREPNLPIDDSDGGCDSDPGLQSAYRDKLISMGRNPDAPWKRQIAAIDIEPGDAITDSAEAFYLMKQRGISNMIVMGVHTNMCVLGRPFSIRQMVYQGQNVVLVRDLTDTMYNPARAPFVSHFTGTDLVIEHIEKHWCPTTTSADLVGGKEFRFQNDRRPTLAIVMAEDEYDTATTLPEFSQKFLVRDFRVHLLFANAEDPNDVPGIDVLEECDVALMSIRRRVLPKPQMDAIRKYLADGKPLVAIRTTSHAFTLRDGSAAEGFVDWPEFDRQVLGGYYRGHHGDAGPDDPKTYVWAVAEAQKHPVMAGVPTEEFVVQSSLYRHQPLAKTATPLMMGRVEGPAPHEPVAWTNTTPWGGKVFYTMMGHPDDFQVPAFERLLRNGLYWASGLPIDSPSASESP